MPVKIILRETVEHLGERGDILTVAPGYARNFLFPKGLALEATPGNLKTIEHQRRVWALREEQEQKEAQALADRLWPEVIDAVEPKLWEVSTVLPILQDTTIVAAGPHVDNVKLSGAVPVGIVGDAGRWVKTPQ